VSVPAVSSVVGRGVETGFLTPDEVRRIAREGLAQLPLDGKRVLVLIPDGTRTMPMPLLFDVLEQALAPRPGITCKVLFVDPARGADAQAADWLARLPADASPRLLAPLPVFGYPGWLPESGAAAFYDDARYFRPLRDWARSAR